MEAKFNLSTHSVDSFIRTDQFKDIRSGKQEGNLQLSSGTYRISWDQDRPQVDRNDKGSFTGIKDFFARGCSTETRASRLQNALELPGKAIFMPNPTIDMLDLICGENEMMANRGKTMLPLVANSKADVVKLEAAREKLLDMYNGDLKSKSDPAEKKKAAGRIATLQSTTILEKSVLKNLRGDDKLYVLGHGQVGGGHIGDNRLDMNHLLHLSSCDQPSHTEPDCKADIETDLEKDEYSTPESVAKSLKGSVPRDFSRFYTLTCHSAEARNPISLETEDLKKATQSNLDGDSKRAYAQRFANALHKEGFTQPRVTGYIGAVVVNPDGDKHTCNVKLEDGTGHNSIPRRGLKHVFSPEIPEGNKK